jgi:serine/threonine protein kinase
LSAAPAREGTPARSAAPIRDPDRYEILGEHGRDGLGRVSRAHDKDLGRDIAIKELLSRGHLNELRFAREAMITARLEHRHRPGSRGARPSTSAWDCCTTSSR